MVMLLWMYDLRGNGGAGEGSLNTCDAEQGTGTLALDGGGVRKRVEGEPTLGIQVSMKHSAIRQVRPKMLSERG